MAPAKVKASLASLEYRYHRECRVLQTLSKAKIPTINKGWIGVARVGRLLIRQAALGTVDRKGEEGTAAGRRTNHLGDGMVYGADGGGDVGSWTSEREGE